MNPTTFDRMAKSLSTRVSRRAALRRGVTGAAAATLGAVALARRVAAEGTPTATAAGMAADNATLFVQTATSGTFVPNPKAGTPAPAATAATATGTPTAAHGAYLLTLQGHDGQTIAFSDRPKRDFGTVATPQLFQAGMFPAANPPNAAIVAGDPGGPQDVVLLELLNPAYDGATKTLSYEAEVLAGYHGQELKSLDVRNADHKLSASFGASALFIDDCPDAIPLNCYQSGGNKLVVGDLGTQGMCWDWHDLNCLPCIGFAIASKECDAKFPACAGDCVAYY